MFEIVALIFQGVKRLVLNMPSAAPSFHDGFYGFFVKRNISHPAPDMLFTFFIGFDKIKHINLFCIFCLVQPDVIGIAKPPLNSSLFINFFSTVNFSFFIQLIHRFNQRGMVAIFRDNDVMPAITLNQLDSGVVSIKTVQKNNEL